MLRIRHLPATTTENHLMEIIRRNTSSMNSSREEDSSSVATPLLESEEEHPPRKPWKHIFLAFWYDDKGDATSIFGGLFTLCLAGILAGLILPKSPDFPTLYSYLSNGIGYTYFICWSVSFYPQAVRNFQRKTTTGLSPDFCTLNVLGFACYGAYNIALYCSPTIRHEYRETYGQQVPVQSNDIAFAVHAIILSTLTLVQIIVYDGFPTLQWTTKAFVLFVLVLILLFPLSSHSWLSFLYLLSLIKVTITVIKYMPQVYLNYARQSCAGWSIWQILLDFSGGFLSILQLVLDCSVIGDFSGITGNIAKLLLGIVSLLFDTVFMVQHYVLYPDAIQAEPIPTDTVEEDREVI